MRRSGGVAGLRLRWPSCPASRGAGRHPEETRHALGTGAGLLPAPPAPPPENPWKVATQTEDLWEKVFLGEELCADAELGALRRQLVANVVDGVATARALAGELLLVQTAAKDQVPEIFKHVGEAYYHWRPRLPPGCGEDDPLEKALANWLSRHARIMGLPNSIQLVRPGERFDASRHVSSGAAWRLPMSTAGSSSATTTRSTPRPPSRYDRTEPCPGFAATTASSRSRG